MIYFEDSSCSSVAFPPVSLPVSAAAKSKLMKKESENTCWYSGASKSKSEPISAITTDKIKLQLALIQYTLQICVCHLL